jgi:hypothetical protein
MATHLIEAGHCTQKGDMLTWRKALITISLQTLKAKGSF